MNPNSSSSLPNSMNNSRPRGRPCGSGDKSKPNDVNMRKKLISTTLDIPPGIEIIEYLK